jgi:hypothetical protein
VASHIGALKDGITPSTPQFATVREALDHAQAGLARFLTSPRSGLPG